MNCSTSKVTFLSSPPLLSLFSTNTPTQHHKPHERHFLNLRSGSEHLLLLTASYIISTQKQLLSLLVSDLLWVFLGRRERGTLGGRWMAIQTWLKGLPIVLRLSVVREGHFDLPGGECTVQREREAERHPDTESEREMTSGQKGAPAFMCPPQVLNHHTSERTLVCVRELKLKRRVKPELWCVSFTPTKHSNENVHKWRGPWLRQWVS